MPTMVDSLKWYPRIEVAKWNPETMAAITAELGYTPGFDELMQITGAPDDIVYDEGNEMTTAGLAAVTGLILGLGGQAFNAANSIIGVGNSTTAFSAGQTALVGTSYYRPTDSAPFRTNGAMSAAATFGGSDANFVWNEWCWATGTGTVTANATLASVTAGTEVMWNRKVVSLGTKEIGAQWTLSTTITLT